MSSVSLLNSPFLYIAIRSFMCCSKEKQGICNKIANNRSAYVCHLVLLIFAISVQGTSAPPKDGDKLMGDTLAELVVGDTEEDDEEEEGAEDKIDARVLDGDEEYLWVLLGGACSGISSNAKAACRHQM